PFANHGSGLSYDGKTWYGLSLGGAAQNATGGTDIEVLDISNPSSPRLLLNWSSTSLPALTFAEAAGRVGYHDMDLNADGSRIYLAVDALGTNVSNGMMILDTSDLV